MNMYKSSPILLQKGSLCCFLCGRKVQQFRNSLVDLQVITFCHCQITILIRTLIFAAFSVSPSAILQGYETKIYQNTC
jgi:hypothetical protein